MSEAIGSEHCALLPAAYSSDTARQMTFCMDGRKSVANTLRYEVY